MTGLYGSAARGSPRPPIQGNPTTLIGHQAEVLSPPYTDYLDFELELGFVVRCEHPPLGCEELSREWPGHVG
jgi:2-keto-4-pentenoate hydratase/2-oxohepta-3-ene-1,7-dioic acid hydratase in catechol pathway